MFDFLFGGTERINLIRKLLEHKGKDSSISRFKLHRTHESAIVTYVQVAIISQRRGWWISKIIPHIEKNLVSKINPIDPKLYDDLLKKSQGSISDANLALQEYIYHRVCKDYRRSFDINEIKNDIEYVITLLTDLPSIQGEREKLENEMEDLGIPKEVLEDMADNLGKGKNLSDDFFKDIENRIKESKNKDRDD